MIATIMEQFNLEKYKALVAEGKTPKLVTRDGRSARVICTDRKCRSWPIVALVQEGNGIEYIHGFTVNGNLDATCEYDVLDLFFADPEPTYRPYKNAEECIEGLQDQSHGCLIKRKGHEAYYLLTTITSEFILLGAAHTGISYAELFEEFEFMDGSPCGVKEDN